MHRAQEDGRISVKLSEVLREIGVNEQIVMMRRRCTFQQEITNNVSLLVNELDTFAKMYHFGSRTEGSTTVGLKSDVDALFCFPNFHVIQDLAEWKSGVNNLLIVQDETTSPGYCLIQQLRNDSPQATTHAINNYHLEDDKGRILCKNTMLNQIITLPGVQQNGPANTVDDIPSLDSLDVVFAFHCDSWPVEGRSWLDRSCVGNWPSMDIKRLAKSKGFFLVPVSSKCNNMISVEWRISTSMAERLMMFNLNITQLRCYVMLKMISKTFFTLNGVSLITSFMNKCTLFHCVENTPECYWREDNLLSCVMKCICLLQDRVQNLNCPHYIIPTNNLMAHRIDADQQQYLLQVIDRLVRRNIDMLFDIEIDDLGQKLRVKMNSMFLLPRNIPSIRGIELLFAVCNLLANVRLNDCFINCTLYKVGKQSLPEAASNLVNGIRRLQIQYPTFSEIETETSANVAPLLCTIVGSILASFSVHTNNTVSPEAIWWFTAGLDTDVSSSRLKLASAFYCAGDVNNAELILREIEQKYTAAVVLPICCCSPPFEENPLLTQWLDQLFRNNVLINETIACCVRFARNEMSIIPQELRQELFRSTAEEVQNRPPYDRRWMDLGVVDSRPYLHFLQYKVFKHLGHHQEQRKALSNLLKTTLNEPKLAHRETAWNLLGQCMDQENMPVEALWCYDRSIEVRPQNNAAYFHKARLRGVLDNPPS